MQFTYLNFFIDKMLKPNFVWNAPPKEKYTLELHDQMQSK